MANAFKLPDLGEGLTEGEVARWLVSEGQAVDEDEPLVEIQTDKATVEIPSPYAGTVLEIRVPEGEVAPVGTVLVVIGEPGETFEAAPAKAPSSSSSQGGPATTRVSGSDRVQATPLVRKVAAELGVDLAAVSATGPGGRISEDDVRAAAGGAEHERRSTRAAARRAKAHRHAHGPGAPGDPGGHLGRGVRLRAGRARAAARDRGEGRGEVAGRVSRAQRATRGRGDRVPRPLRHRHRGADRAGPRRSRRARR